VKPKHDAHKAEQQDAYAVAVRALGIREYCEVELRGKLTDKAFDEIIIDNVIEKLKHYDYLSESRFAASFLRSRLKRGETPWLAARKARQKGVDIPALNQAVADAEAIFDAYAACQELLDKRDSQQLRKHDKRVWHRQVRFLQNKGFDLSLILQVMNNEEEKA